MDREPRNRGEARHDEHKGEENGARRNVPASENIAQDGPSSERADDVGHALKQCKSVVGGGSEAIGLFRDVVDARGDDARRRAEKGEGEGGPDRREKARGDSLRLRVGVRGCGVRHVKAMVVVVVGGCSQ